MGRMNKTEKAFHALAAALQLEVERLRTVDMDDLRRQHIIDFIDGIHEICEKHDPYRAGEEKAFC